MIKIKVGDKVRVTRADDRISDDGELYQPQDLEHASITFPLGEIVTVTNILKSSSMPYGVSSDDIDKKWDGTFYVNEVELVEEEEMISKAELFAFLESAKVSGRYWITNAAASEIINHFNLKPKSRFVDISLRVEVGSEDEKTLSTFLDDTNPRFIGMKATRITAQKVEE